MKRWKALLSLLMCAVLILPTLAACGQKVEYTYGRYVEEDISPKEMEGSPMNFVIHGDGTMDVIGLKQTELEPNKRYRLDYSHWRSTDSGATWAQLDTSWLDEYENEIEYQSDPEQAYEMKAVQYLVPLASGNVLMSVHTERYTPPAGTEEEGMYGNYEYWSDLYLVDAQGNAKPLELQGLEEMQDQMQAEAAAGGMDMPAEAPLPAATDGDEPPQAGSEAEGAASAPGAEDPQIDPPSSGGSNGLQLGNIVLLSDNRALITLYTNYGPNMTAVFNPDTGEKIYDVETDGWQTFYNATTLYTMDYSEGLRAFNIEDGTPSNVELPSRDIQDRYFANFWGGGMYADNEGSIYQVSARGTYKFTSGTTDEPEMVMDGINYTYGSPLYYVNGTYYDAADDTLVLNLYESSIYSGRDYTTKLVRYVWDDEAIATSSRKIKVYSLYDSGVVRLALSEFKRQNPDITIEYETAFDYNSSSGGVMPLNGAASGADGSAKTVEDALRALNVEMLNGTGPDILILDGMPIESFVNQNVLEDLSPLVAENSDLFGTLADSMRMNDGIYAFPAKVYVPTLFGEDGYVQQFTDLNTLAQAVVNGPDAPGGTPPADDASEEEWTTYWNEQNQYRPLEEYPVMYFESLDDIMNTFYASSTPAIYSEMGGVNQENLAAYMQAVKDVGEKLGYNNPEQDTSIYGGGGVMISTGGSYATFEYSGTFYRYGNRQSQLGYQAMGSMYDLLMLASNLHWSASPGNFAKPMGADGEEADPAELPEIPAANPAFVPAPGLAQGVFFPQVIAGVASYTNEKELAMSFVSMLLSPDVQKHEVGGGFPASRSAFGQLYEAVVSNQAAYYEQEGIKTIPFDYEALMGGLTTPNFTNEFVDNLVKQYTQQFCAGEISLEEAVANVTDETRMYFAERQ